MWDCAVSDDILVICISYVTCLVCINIVVWAMACKTSAASTARGSCLTDVGWNILVNGCDESSICNLADLIHSLILVITFHVYMLQLAWCVTSVADRIYRMWICQWYSDSVCQCCEHLLSSHIVTLLCYLHKVKELITVLWSFVLVW